MASAYEILGVSAYATEAEIRAAYRSLARQSHPDLHGNSEAATERFVRIRAAYDILMDPEQRAQHDRDPEGTVETQVWREQRARQLERRRKRLRRLYE